VYLQARGHPSKCQGVRKGNSLVLKTLTGNCLDGCATTNAVVPLPLSGSTCFPFSCVRLCSYYYSPTLGIRAMATEMEETVAIFKGPTPLLSHFSFSLHLSFGYFLFLLPPPPQGLTSCVHPLCACSQCHFYVLYTTEICFDYELTSLRILPSPLIYA